MQPVVWFLWDRSRNNWRNLYFCNGNCLHIEYDNGRFLSELNALMPNTTGGLAQYTLACMGPFPTIISMVGGYILCNVLSCGVEASIFSYAMSDTFSFLHIPSLGYVLIVTTLLMIANLFGVDIFAKLQDVVAFLLVGSMLLMGIIGAIGIGFGKRSTSRIPWQRISTALFP